MEGNNRKKYWLAAGVFLLLLCAGCGIKKAASDQKPWKDTDFAMGTVISQNIYGGQGEEIADRVLEEIQELEETISWRMNQSDIAKVNQKAGTKEGQKVSSKVADWLKDCVDVYEKSGKALDVTIGPVARLWDIGGENPKVPSKQEIEKTLDLVDGSKLQMKEEQVFLNIPKGKLDLGAVGKGIACDEIGKMLEQQKTQVEMNGTFSVGGSVLLYGRKPDQSSWKIGIQDPRGKEGENMAALSISQEKGEQSFLSTSGDYEKYIEKEGIRYHHILDPRTGYPAESGLISVTILSESGFLSDALSTACFVLGLSEGKKLAESYGAEAVFIDQDKNVFVTPGIEEELTILKKEYKKVQLKRWKSEE